jgi:hypothetical protein
VALVLLALAVAGSEARSEETSGVKDWLGISGTARASFFTKDNTFVDNAGVQCDSLWITATPHEIGGIKMYFDARIQGQFVSGNSKIRGDLREGYLEKSIANLDLKLGRQIIVWGRADKINPTDVWSVRDYRLLVTDDDDQRIGILTAQAAWNLGNQRLIAVWQPEFRPPVLPIPPQPSGTQLTNVVASPRASQAGIKFDHSGTGFDWSFSYAHAINRTPDLALRDAGANNGNQPQPGLNYNFTDVFGADAAAPIGKFGFRGEAAYIHGRNHDGLDPLAQNDNFFAVVGVERTWGGKLNLNIQYLFKHSFDYHEPGSISDSQIRSLARQARLVSNQLASAMNGASFRVNYKALNETLETEVSGAIWFKKMDSFVMLKLSYAFSDRIKGIVGANIWSGPRDSFFGRLRTTSTGFVELRFGL